jgi:uncharacterized protein (TIGR02118 family)
MIKISILYPNGEDSWFDMDYYINKHVPFFINHLIGSNGFRGVSVEKGVSSESSDSNPLYIVSCHFLFDSVEDFFNAFNPHDEKIQEDMINYTDIKPVIHISERIKLQSAF